MFRSRATSRTRRGPFRGLPFAAAVLTAASLAAVPAVAPAARANEGNPTVLAWGAGHTGQIGNGTLADSLSPSSVTSLFRGDVDQISAAAPPRPTRSCSPGPTRRSSPGATTPRASSAPAATRNRPCPRSSRA
ncbi:RCC1 domain-containing protein [Streptomyces diastatochromogenes]|nr:RCC1 domain-containing protein [Streptomyces diastatochromogenes]